MQFIMVRFFRFDLALIASTAESNIFEPEMMLRVWIFLANGEIRRVLIPF